MRGFGVLGHRSSSHFPWNCTSGRQSLSLTEKHTFNVDSCALCACRVYEVAQFIMLMMLCEFWFVLVPHERYVHSACKLLVTPLHECHTWVSLTRRAHVLFWSSLWSDVTPLDSYAYDSFQCACLELRLTPTNLLVLLQCAVALQTFYGQFLFILPTNVGFWAFAYLLVSSSIQILRT